MGVSLQPPGSGPYASLTGGNRITGTQCFDGAVWEAGGPYIDITHAKYGAVAGDTGDNYAAIVAALADGNSLGIPVRVPMGTFRVVVPTSQNSWLTIPSNTALEGLHKSLSRLHFVTAATGCPGLYIDGRTVGKFNIGVRKLGLVGAQATYSLGTVPAYGIYIDNATDTAVFNHDLEVWECDFDSFGIAGVAGNSSSAVTRRLHVDKNTIHDIGTITQNPGSPVAGIGGIPSSDVTYIGNDFYNVGNAAGDWAIYQSRTARGLIMAHNTVLSCQGGLKLGAEAHFKVEIASNIIRDPITNNAIVLDPGAHQFVDIHANEIELVTAGTRAAIAVATLSGGMGVHVHDNLIDAASITIGTGVITITGACPGLEVDNNHVLNVGSNAYGIYVTGTGGALRRLKIHDNTITGTTGSRGVWLREATGTDNIEDPEVYNNTIFGGDFGVTLTGTLRPVVSENRITLSTGSRTENIRLEDGAGVNTHVTRAWVHHNRTPGANANNYISYSGVNCKIEDNMGFAVRLTPSMADSGCAVRRNWGPGTAPLTAVSGATFSLDALTLGDENVIVTQSGATTVTAFTGSAFKGELRRLYAGDANTTVQNNASCALRGGADYAMASGAMLTLLMDGSVWREVARAA